MLNPYKQGAKNTFDGFLCWREGLSVFVYYGHLVHNDWLTTLFIRDFTSHLVNLGFPVVSW